MAHNFQRPNIPYSDAESLQNDKRYQLLTDTLNRPVPPITLDSDFNYLIDAVRQLDKDIENIEEGILQGADDPVNAFKLPTTDGAGNISWVNVSAENIEDNSITGIKLVENAITFRELADAAVIADKLATNSVTTVKILDFNVTANKLAADSIGTAKIIDGAVSGNKILNGAITATKISDGAVITSKIPDNAITTAKIANANVTLVKLAQEVLDRLVPVGTVIEFAGTTGLPALWLECNGQAVSRATYATLFTNIGTTYGVGDGVSTFNLPDHRGRVSVGIGSDDSTSGRITAATAASITLGGTFGAETHTLTIAQMPAHTHTIANLAAVGDAPNGNGGNSLPLQGASDTGSTGGGAAHNNTQPSIFMRYYIRAL